MASPQNTPSLLAALKATTPIVEGQLRVIIESNATSSSGFDPASITDREVKADVRRFTKALAAARKVLVGA